MSELRIADVTSWAAQTIEETHNMLRCNGAVITEQVPHEVLDTLISLARGQERHGDMLGADILLASIGIQVDRVDDGK